MTRIILPAQLFFFAGGLLMAVQFAQEKFAIPALAPLVYNLGIIMGGIILSPRLGMVGFSWGVLAGAILGNFLIQLWGAQRVGLRFRLSFYFRHPDLKRYILLTLPLMLGLTMTFSTEFFLKFFGSFLERGAIAAMNYGFRVMFILVGVFGQAAGVASFPFLAGLAVRGKSEEMNTLLNDTLRRYISLVLPFSVLFMVLRHEVILILFQRGKFDADATALTSSALVFLLVGAFAFAAQTVVTRGYYAMQNTLFPSIFGSIAVIVSIPIYWFGMKFFGVNGVALAISLSAILQVVLLYVLWNRRTANTGAWDLYRFFGKVIILSISVGLILEGLKRTVLISIDNTTHAGCLIISGIACVIFLALIIAGGVLLRINEIVRILDHVKRKFL